MIPNLIFNGRIVTPYMICALVGIFAAGTFALKSIGKEREQEYLILLLWSSVGVAAGGSLLYGITNLSYIIYCVRNEAGLISILQAFGGSVFYGGLFGGLLAGLIACRIRNTRSRPYMDVTAMFIPLFHTFGRLGCFLSGCCYGVESPFGFICRWSLIEQANGIRRFPVQAVEGAGNFLIFILLFRMWKQGRWKERLLNLYFLLYSVLRFMTEFFRGDEYRGILFGLSVSQWISLAVFASVMIASAVKQNPRISD